jgi:alanyl-tRNA synthetase
VTERLYYSDAYATTFEATIVASGETDRLPWVTLDRTAFYPTSGGQPHDVGTLEDAAVVDVVDREDGSIAHLLDRPLETGTVVRGTIDWNRRFDHMQQHTGQHLLSAAFDRLFQARTVSFHLGTDACTIDLDRVVAGGAIAAGEQEANRVVWQDLEVSVRFVSAAEAAALPLRKEPQREGVLRLVGVGDFDLSACGGTHVARTGAVGIVAVSGWEKFRGGLRVEFSCGGRALARFRTLRDAVAGSIRTLSVLPDELPDAIARAQAENKELRRLARGLTEQLAAHEAEQLRAAAVRVGSVSFVAEAREGWDAGGLKALATAVAARPGHLAVCVNTTAPLLVAIARSADVDVDAAGLLRALTAEFGGRGGGRGELAQGGGLVADPALVTEAVKKLLT